MNTPEDTGNPFIDGHNQAVFNAEKRLKGTAPVGSGPATGSAGRAAVEETGEGPERKEGGTTDCSRDSRAVPPGEAEAALSNAEWWLRAASANLLVASLMAQKFGDEEKSQFFERGAARAVETADDIKALLPKPDSDARHDEAALTPTPPQDT